MIDDFTYIPRRSIFHKSVNYVLSLTLALFVVLLIIIGITQTATFREYARSFLLETLNKDINGRISLRKIEGTIFTSLVLRDAVLTDYDGLIARVDRAELKLSPLQIFFKTIFVRAVDVQGVTLRLVKGRDGVLNIAKVFPPSDEDTTESSFPFIIDVAEARLRGVDVSLQDWDKAGSTATYNGLNLSDFRVRDVNLHISAMLDIDRNDYALTLHSASAAFNLNGFALRDMEGLFRLQPGNITVNAFRVKTALSEIGLDADISGLNIFKPVTRQMLADTYVRLALNAADFDFADLTTLVPAVDMLKGPLGGAIEANGTLAELDISRLDLRYGKTTLSTTGKLFSLDQPSQMRIMAVMSGSVLRPADVAALLPGISIPQYPGLEQITIDTITYAGEPVNFLSRFALKTAAGGLSGSCAFDFSGDEMLYDVTLLPAALSLRPFIAYPVLLNGEIKAKGKGTNPATLVSDFSARLTDSRAGWQPVDECTLEGTFKDRILKTELSLNASRLKISGGAELDLTEEHHPVYTCNVLTKGLDLSPFVMDSSLSSSIDLAFAASGSSFALEQMAGKYSVSVTNSSMYGKQISDIHADLVVDAGENNSKSVSLFSTLFDFSLHGSFTYADLDSVFRREITGIVREVNGVRVRYFGLDSISTPEIAFSKGKPEKKPVKKQLRVAEKPPLVALEYSAVFKDLQPLSFFFNDRRFEVDGELHGKLNSDARGFSFSAAADLGFMKYWGESDAYFATDASCSVSLDHLRDSLGIKNLIAGAALSAAKVYAAGYVNDMKARVTLRGGELKVDAGGDYNSKMRAALAAQVDLTAPSLECVVSQLSGGYNLFDLRNTEPIILGYYGHSLHITNFNLTRGDSRILVDGTLSESGFQDIKVLIANFKGYDISYNLLNLSPSEAIDNDLNVYATLTGTLQDPIMTITLQADSIRYKGNNFGSLKSLLKYSKQTLLTDIRFLERKRAFDEARLKVNGIVPIDLSFMQPGERLPLNRELRLDIKSQDFNLAVFGDALPFINNVQGILSADMKIGGTYNNLKRSGDLLLENASFVAEANNLEYGGAVKLLLAGDTLAVDSIYVENRGRVNKKGIVRGTGLVEFDGLRIKGARFSMNGDLTVLTNESKAVNPSLYGNLYVQSDGDILFTRNGEYSQLYAPILVKEASLTFPPLQGGYGSNPDNFIYRYLSEKIPMTERELEIQRLILINEKKNGTSGKDQKINANFDYDIRIRIKDEAKIVFVFSQEANQALTALLKGDIRYERKNGIQNMQGELQVLDGSTLEFLKTFTAAGSLRFESDITNPYLNITATYKDYYLVADTVGANAGKEEEVAVKVKLKGPLSDLSKNFAQMENNIAVYKGSTSIQNEEPSTEYDKADAVWFIITGKFRKDLTAQDKTQASGTLLDRAAPSLAGSLLGGLLNTYLGDYVKSLEIRNVGAGTRFNLSGKFKDLRYTIGGSTNVFQDFSTANVRIEYPLIENFLIRVERREASAEANYTNEMISELGLKYKFEF